MCLGEFDLKFTERKTMLCTKLSLVVLTTLAIFIALFPCCLEVLKAVLANMMLPSSPFWCRSKA